MLHFQTCHLILIVPCGQSGVHIPHDAGRQGKDPELLSPGPEVCLLPCKPSSPHFHFPAVHLSGKGIHSPSLCPVQPLGFRPGPSSGHHISTSPRFPCPSCSESTNVDQRPSQSQPGFPFLHSHPSHHGQGHLRALHTTPTPSL